MKPSEDMVTALAARKESKRSLPPILALTFDATVHGWKQFSIDAIVANAAGYDLLAISPLGTQSFGAVWKMVRQVKSYPDFLGVEDDEFTLAGDEDQ